MSLRPTVNYRFTTLVTTLFGSFHDTSDAGALQMSLPKVPSFTSGIVFSSQKVFFFFTSQVLNVGKNFLDLSLRHRVSPPSEGKY